MKGLSVAKDRAPAQLADAFADFEKNYVGPAEILSELRRRAAVEAFDPNLYQDIRLQGALPRDGYPDIN